ncbi:MAG: MFS transporter [Planctomycetota bacterium]
MTENEPPPYFALQFLKQNPRWLVGCFLLTAFSSFGQTFFISQFSKPIRTQFELSDGDFGLLYMLATLASAMTLVWLGKIVDRMAIANVSAIIIIGLSIACCLISLTRSILLLFVAIFALRLFGQGMMTHTSQTAIGKWYSADRGRAISLTTMGHQFGEAIFPSLVLIAVAAFGWQATWQIAAASLLCIALPMILILLRVERQPNAFCVTPSLQKETNCVRHWNRDEVLKDVVFWGLLVSVLAPAFIGTAVFFHQDHLMEAKGWPNETFARAFIILAIFTITFTLIGGWLVDQLSARVLLPFFLLPMGIGCFILGASEPTVSLFVFMAMLGGSFGLSSALFGTIWPETYGTQNLGSIRAMAVAAMVFASALGPGITGWCIDHTITFSSQLFAMGIYCVCASTLMVVVARMLKSRELRTV